VYFVALRMLMGDTTKYLALVFGLAFSTTLVVQQGSIFVGILKRTCANIETIPQADIWVMHPATRYLRRAQGDRIDGADARARCGRRGLGRAADSWAAVKRCCRTAPSRIA